MMSSNAGKLALTLGSNLSCSSMKRKRRRDRFRQSRRRSTRKTSRKSPSGGNIYDKRRPTIITSGPSLLSDSIKPDQSESNQIKPTRPVLRNPARMKDDTETLAELMLHAEQFCSKVENAMEDIAPLAEQTELRLKIGQCKNQL